jgi:nitrite reductase/ring-hydroxylating ferredoxin subunit
MLSQADNELATRVGPGTPMGRVMREYWLPALESSDLEPDGAPMKVKLLGEDLIAFRDTTGKVGLLATHCPHRGASLFFGRNEESGLRCVYHGWKFSLTGECLDMPNEPPESDFKHKVRVAAYPCQERNGIVWTYMGPRGVPPPLPELEGNLVPRDHTYVLRALRECNWLQALEGDVDSSHISYLHSLFGSSATFKYKDYEYRHRDKRPYFEVAPTEYGAIYGARRTIDELHYHWRLALFLMPFYTIIPPNYPSRLHLSMWVPLDDENTLFWGLVWDPHHALSEEERRLKGRGAIAGFESEEYLPSNSEPLSRWRFTGGKDNDYLIDYTAQRTLRFSGVPTFHLQDKAMTESMGPICDRRREHLTASDSMVIQVRRRLLGAVKQFQDGVTPPGVDTPSIYRARSASLVLDKQAPWLEGAQPFLRAFTDTPVAFPA